MKWPSYRSPLNNPIYATLQNMFTSNTRSSRNNRQKEQEDRRHKITQEDRRKPRDSLENMGKNARASDQLKAIHLETADKKMQLETADKTMLTSTGF